jgi:DNA-binding NtrC family response regulator
MFSDAIILVTGASLSDRETILQALGHECHVVASQSTDDALAHVADSVDVVVSEVRANQFDGLELLRRWRSRQPHTPFLMLVEQRDTALAVEAMKNGAADCIVKPIDVDELRSAVQQVFRSRALNSHSNSDQNPPGGQRRKPAIEIPPNTSLEDLERAAVEQALIQHQGNRTHAARTLGISVRTLQRKLKAWGMPMMSSFPAFNHSYMMSSSIEAPASYSAHVH